MTQVFDHIQDTVQARGGDTVVERALLLKARISIRFGSFNHCAFDERSPAGALCLDNAKGPPEHTGPLPDRCRPDRCPTASSDPNTCRSGVSSNAPCSPSSTPLGCRPAAQRSCSASSPRSEAAVSRATMNRARLVIAEWDTEVAECDGLTPGEARKNDELTQLRTKLADKTAEARTPGRVSWRTRPRRGFPPRGSVLDRRSTASAGSGGDR